MAESQIRWKKGDYISLGKAVSLHNKLIREHRTEQNKLWLPSEINYTEVKGKITTRKELNRVIASLRRITLDNAFDLYVDEAGIKWTNWEYKELQKQSRIAIRNLNKVMAEFNIPKYDGFSRAEMGSQELRQLKRRKEDIEEWETKTSDAKKRTVRRIREYGKLDLSMYRSIIYRQNYMKVLERYSHLDNYNLLIDKLNSIKNPISFYEFMKNGTELTEDLFYQSDQHYTQQAFNSYIESLGIEIVIDSTS